MNLSHGQQIATIVYGKGDNIRTLIDEYKSRGFIVIQCDCYATVHLKVKK